MGFKKKIEVLIFLSIVPMISFSQDCGTMHRNTVQKNRKYYLLDSSNSILNFEEIKSELKSKDTAFVRLMIEKGKENENYLELFLSRGVLIKKIGFDEFYKLPKDSVVWSRKEKRRLKRNEELLNEYKFLIINDKPTASISKKLGKSKFTKLVDKFESSNPYLFVMYPMYTYENFTLLMYSIYTGNKRIGIAFIYEICKTNSW